MNEEHSQPLITYFCKYAPLELLSALGAGLDEPNREIPDFRRADALIHTSVCSHAKILLEECIAGSTQGTDLVLTNCCDTIRRIGDTIAADPGLASGFTSRVMLDLPHTAVPHAVRAWKDELLRLRDTWLRTHPGSFFDRSLFLAKWKKQADDWAVFGERGPFIAIFGARVSNELRAKIRNTLPLPVIDLTCGGLRTLPPPPPEAFLHDCAGCDGSSSEMQTSAGYAAERSWKLSDDELLSAYAEALLKQLPCTRMQDLSARSTLLRHPSLAGIVYHSVRFCDYYSFEYAGLRRSTALPVLKIETDYTAQSVGQMETRLAAFAESLPPSSAENSAEVTRMPGEAPAAGTSASFRSRETAEAPRKVQTAPAFSEKDPAGTDPKREVSGGIYIGIDSGSTSTNAAAIDSSGRLLAYAIVRTGARAGTAAERAYEDIRIQLGADAERIRRVIATGYGREFITFADGTRTEISCHARGAHFTDPSARCVIDIGGQDSKVICLDEDGNVINFVMNDKCAAGTGRFLEMMAHTLETDLSTMSTLGLKWKKDLTISSTCTVFAESEVVSLIAENTASSDIVHALNKSVASRTAGMVRRVRGAGPYMMTGGVARNRGVVSELEERLGEKLSVCAHPDLIGAIGAALFAAGRQ